MDLLRIWKTEAMEGQGNKAVKSDTEGHVKSDMWGRGWPNTTLTFVYSLQLAKEVGNPGE